VKSMLMDMSCSIKKREGVETNSFYNRLIDIESALFGNTILLSATKRRWDDVLSLCQERDEVENKSDDLKNELEAMPLRVQKIETLQGLLFIFFVSLIMRAILLRKAREAELLDNISIEEILMELAKLRAVKVGGKWRLTEISKNQRTILEKMKIGIPVEANLVIKRAEV